MFNSIINFASKNVLCDSVIDGFSKKFTDCNLLKLKLVNRTISIISLDFFLRIILIDTCINFTPTRFYMFLRILLLFIYIKVKL